jgi:hypothetical protein
MLPPLYSSNCAYILRQYLLHGSPDAPMAQTQNMSYFPTIRALSPYGIPHAT